MNLIYLAALPTMVFCFIYLTLYVLQGSGGNELRIVLGIFIIATFVFVYKHLVTDKE